MKRFLMLILAFGLLAGAVFAEGAEPLPAEEAENLPVPEEAVPAEDAAEAGAEASSSAADPEEKGETVPMPDEENEPADPEELPDEEELQEEVVDGRTLQYGDEGSDVLELQTRLQELKYYTGSLSGRYREGTREAVKAFQGDYGLEKTGIADPDTQARIFSARYRALRYGAEGEEVKKLQSRLVVLGYYKGKVSGNYLGGTQKSVREFQEASGLPVTGAADPLTLEALYAPDARGKGDAAEPSAQDAAGFLVNDADHAGGTGSPTAFVKELKSGSRGDEVKQLQARMTELGYYEGPVSGNFARQTLRAVKKIQTQNGLKATGRVNEETWNVIFNDGGIVLPGATPKPTPEPTPVPYAMTVDVNNQVTSVYALDEKGEYTVPVRRMICSTGTKANPSDVGDWVLNGRHAKWCVFPTWGNSYARYWTRINASIAFHSVIYTAVDLDAMKTSSYKMLGNRASHGCVRLTVEDAKWVYENIGAGTVVSIREDLPSDPELRDAVKLPPLKKGTSIPVETPEPTPEPEYRAEQLPDLGGKRLKKRSEGPEVYWVQKRLTELGYYTGYAGGRMLDGTVRAVKAFQKANGIYASGEVDDKTLELMKAEPAPETAQAPERTIAPETTIAPEMTPAPEGTPSPAAAAES